MNNYSFKIFKLALPLKGHLLLFGIYLFVSSCTVSRTVVRLDPTYQIIESDRSRDELFVNANIWMVESFKSAKDVI